MEYLAVGIYIENLAGTCLKNTPPTSQLMFIHMLK